MPQHIQATPRVCNLALWRTDGSASKNETALAKTRQTILPMVLGESWADFTYRAI
jgi:hypothetical protein